MIFIKLKTDSVAQINDMIRLDASLSFVSPDEAAITLVRIKPSASDSFISVTSKKYIDWEYDSSGTKTITVEITTDGLPVEKEFNILVLDEASDNLFSNDNDLQATESDILKWLPIGRNSWTFKHRNSRNTILEWLIKNDITKSDGSYFDSSDIFNIDEVRQWAKYETLMSIFENESNAVDDIYHAKMLRYRDMRNDARTKAKLTLDYNNDGALDKTESFNLTSFNMARR